MPNSFRPSIRAAFMISTGKFREFWRNIMIMNGVDSAGIMNAQTVFSSFIWETMVNSGMRVATWGTITLQSDGQKWIVRQDIEADLMDYVEKYREYFNIR